MAKKKKSYFKYISEPGLNEYFHFYLTNILVQVSMLWLKYRMQILLPRPLTWHRWCSGQGFRATREIPNMEMRHLRQRRTGSAAKGHLPLVANGTRCPCSLPPCAPLWLLLSSLPNRSPGALSKSAAGHHCQRAPWLKSTAGPPLARYSSATPSRRPSLIRRRWTVSKDTGR